MEEQCPEKLLDQLAGPGVGQTALPRGQWRERGKSQAAGDACAAAGRLSMRWNTPLARELAPGRPSPADDRPAGCRGQERHRQDRPAPWKAGIRCRRRGRRASRKRRGG
jgi:hypothetical protein